MKDIFKQLSAGQIFLVTLLHFDGVVFEAHLTSIHCPIMCRPGSDTTAPYVTFIPDAL